MISNLAGWGHVFLGYNFKNIIIWYLFTFLVNSAVHQHFFQAGKRKLCEDTRGNDISDSETCKYAAERLNENFISSLNDAGKPKGCYVDLTIQGSFGRKVYYNQNLNSLRTDNASSICKTGKCKKGFSKCSIIIDISYLTNYMKELIYLLCEVNFNLFRSRQSLLQSQIGKQLPLGGKSRDYWRPSWLNKPFGCM